MTVYLVAHEKDSGGKEEPTELRHMLEDLGAERILSSIFVVASSSDAQSLHRYLSDFISPDDRILVTRLTEDFSGYVLREGGAWLDKNKPL